MARKPDTGPREPNLELPSLSLGFRRRKRRRAEDGADNGAENGAENGAGTPTVVEEPAGTTTAPVAVEPEPVRETAPEPDPEPAPATVPEPATRPIQPVPAAPTTETGQEATGERTGEKTGEPPWAPAWEPAWEPVSEPAAADGDEEETAPVHRERRPSPLTRLPGAAAAVLAGIVCGLVGVVLTSLALRGCEAVRGVGSCGGIGLFALFAILVVEIFIGAALLKGAGVRDSFSTSFLGVGLVAVVIMLFLLSELDSLWMLLVIPLVTAATYAFSWWVTTRFVEVE